MMGRQSGQISMLILDIEEMIPENHLLRKINQLVSFDFIYDIAAPYYPDNGRPSVDPVSMFKMLLVGYLYGIKSERRLVQEVQLNIAYRWFCGFELGEKIPDHLNIPSEIVLSDRADGACRPQKWCSAAVCMVCKNRHPSPICTRFEHHFAGVLAPLSRTEAPPALSEF